MYIIPSVMYIIYLKKMHLNVTVIIFARLSSSYYNYNCYVIKTGGGGAEGSFCYYCYYCLFVCLSARAVQQIEPFILVHSYWPVVV